MIEDLYPSVRYQSHPDSPTLLVGLTCMQLYQAIPDYEWQGAFRPFDAHQLYLRDNPQFYYLRGLDGISTGVDDTLAFLRDFTTTRHIRHAAYFGASTGGYAALLFGSLLGADEVHAFAPMTILPSRTLPELLRLVPSQNWTLMARNLELRRNPGLERPYRDIRRLIQNDNGRTIYHVYYGRGHTPDRRNALRLQGLPRVHLHAYDYNRHYLVAELKKTGELPRILAATYQRLTQPQPAAV